ncbi:hypothetical protein L5515_000740 [Caenorhabditis briggsae]|uniref:Uncharacterized protein n=1 Tax=Caenorhabditis briggsae TaxID=6238 RepID=A0AAE9E330_CAEBR|nr:hypothetical protein L5515_000740 [Caenorhabditis briggsae]
MDFKSICCALLFAIFLLIAGPVVYYIASHNGTGRHPKQILPVPGESTLSSTSEPSDLLATSTSSPLSQNIFVDGYMVGGGERVLDTSDADASSQMEKNIKRRHDTNSDSTGSKALPIEEHKKKTLEISDDDAFDNDSTKKHYSHFPKTVKRVELDSSELPIKSGSTIHDFNNLASEESKSTVDQNLKKTAPRNHFSDSQENNKMEPSKSTESAGKNSKEIHSKEENDDESDIVHHDQSEKSLKKDNSKEDYRYEVEEEVEETKILNKKNHGN